MIRMKGMIKPQRSTVLFVSDGAPRTEKIKTMGEMRYPHLSFSFLDELPEDLHSYDVRVFPAKFLGRIWRESGRGVEGRSLREGAFDLCYGDVTDMDLAFLCGCVDYLVEPWETEELFCRVSRWTNRCFIDYSWGRVSFTSFAVSSGKVTLAISHEEFLILRALARNPETPVPRDFLYRCIGRFDLKKDSRVVDVHVSSLRRKLRLCGLSHEVLPGSWNPIRSFRSRGYGLCL